MSLTPREYMTIYKGPCTAHGVHEWKVEGTPHSAMTYYVCDCTARLERGPGAFYHPGRAANITSALELATQAANLCEVARAVADYLDDGSLTKHNEAANQIDQLATRYVISIDQPYAQVCCDLLRKVLAK